MPGCRGSLYESGNGGSTWGGWRSASTTGSDGTTSYQTITAESVPFNQDSMSENRIKFGINDVAGNAGEGEECVVKIDATDPQASAILSSTHPDRVLVKLEHRRFELDIYARAYD